MNIRRGLVAAIVVVLAGCTAIEEKIYSGYAAPPLDKESLAPYAELIDALQNGKPALVPAACFSVPVGSADKQTCKTARNQAVATLAIASSSLCVKHRQTIYGRDAGVNITLGSLTNLFAGAAAVASSESAKTLYAALALFANSERSLVNETIYKQMIVTSVDQKIAETMDTKGAALRQSMAKDIDEFGMHEALQDVVALHTSCSFMTGLRLALAEGTRGSNARKIMTLRQTLSQLGGDVAFACLKKSASDPDGFQCTQAKQRYESVTATLKTLETSGE